MTETSEALVQMNATMTICSPTTVPEALISQLAESGRMIVPVGPAEAQQLQLIRRQDGRPVVSLREPCRFVPLVRGK
jgi:protein-L-isoaspartate(D-aspartate) O-methyltransferase